MTTEQPTDSQVPRLRPLAGTPSQPHGAQSTSGQVTKAGTNSNGMNSSMLPRSAATDPALFPRNTSGAASGMDMKAVPMSDKHIVLEPRSSDTPDEVETAFLDAIAEIDAARQKYRNGKKAVSSIQTASLETILEAIEEFKWQDEFGGTRFERKLPQRDTHTLARIINERLNT